MSWWLNLLLIIVCIVGSWFLSLLINYIDLHYRKKMSRAKHRVPQNKINKPSIIKRLFWLFPRQLLIDYFNSDPDEFKEFGVAFISGEQGSGKTVFMTYYLLELQKKYPLLKVQTNYNYKHENESIIHWKDLIERKNGILGYVNVLDEVQNWFNSLASKDFPPEMMTEISQERKQRTLFLCTTQVFGRVAKPIREQAMVVYEPVTILGCLTLVRVFKPVFDDTGCLKEKKSRGMFFFIHNAELREAYDTYKKVEMMSNIGFKSELEQIRADNTAELSAEAFRLVGTSADRRGLFGRKKK